MKTEDAKTLIEQQIEALGTALEAGHSQQLQEFLGVMARFHKYSLSTCSSSWSRDPK